MRITTVLAGLIPAAVLVFAGEAGAQVRSIEGFMRMKANWDRMQGVQLKLEGRYSSLSKNHLRFRKCDLAFVGDQEFPRLSGQSRTAEVTGKLTDKGGRLVFVVERIRELPSDPETFRSRQSEIRGEVETEWYELADWANGRGTFYEDDELLRSARSAYEKGIAVEYRRLAGKDPEALLKLAAKGKQFGIDESYSLELMHEAYSDLWNAWNKGDQTGKKVPVTLATRVAADLPGSRQPLSPPQPKLRDKYRENPLAEYKASDPQQRQKLHRILYSDIVLAIILLEAEPDDANGSEIAARIDEQLPEFKELADSFRDRQLKHELEHVATSTRAEVIALSERFRGRRQPVQAKQALQNWLQAKESRLRRDGVGGLLQLADESVNLLEDEQAAASVLMEAYELEPNLPEVSERLGRLGYRLHNGKWFAANQLPVEPLDTVRLAIREGRVIPDMTRAEVRQALGAPTSSARMASAGRIAEVWMYGETGTSQLVIQFHRRPRQPDARVVDVVQVRN